MSFGRVSVVEFKTEDGLKQFTKDYAEQYHVNFPNAEASVSVRTGPTSALGMTIYPNNEAVEESLEKRTKFMKDHEHLINIGDSFFYEGEVDFKFLTNVQNQSEDQQSQLDAMQQEIAELKAMLVQFLAKLPT